MRVWNLMIPAAAVLALALAVPYRAAADVPVGAEAIKTHLEFLGYSVTITATQINSKHPTKFDFSLTKFKGGVLLRAFLQIKKTDRLRTLEMVNTLNADAALVRAYIDGDGDLCYEAWTQAYEKQSFADLMSAWEADVAEMTRKYRQESAKW